MFVTIKSRLIAGFSLLLLFLLIISALGLYSTGKMSQNSQSLLSTEVVIGNIADQIRLGVARVRQKEKTIFILIGTASTDDNPTTNMKDLDRLLGRLDEAAAKLKTLPLEAEMADLAAKMPEQVAAYRKAMEGIFKQIESGRLNSSLAADEAMLPHKKITSALGKSAEQISKLAEDRIEMKKAELEAESTRIKQRLLLLSLIAVGVAFAAAWLIARSIISPIHSISEDITRIERDSDLSRGIRYQGADEIGGMAAAINRLVGTLATTMKTLQQQAGELKHSAQQLATASADVRSGSERQADESTSMAAALEEITTSICHISDLSGEVRNKSLESGQAAEQGAAQISTMVSDIRSIAEAIQQASQSAEALDASSDRISGITSVIKDVADQTNLLALNAAIEAARAGEQGRGFAVVADEVRKLAEKTGQSAQEIATTINDVQLSARALAEQMRRSVTSVEAGMQISLTAGETISAITQSAGEVSRMVEDVNMALHEQSNASEMLSKRVELIVQMVDENSRSTGTVAQTADELDLLADRLRNDISRYRVNT